VSRVHEENSSVILCFCFCARLRGGGQHAITSSHQQSYPLTTLRTHPAFFHHPTPTFFHSPSLSARTRIAKTGRSVVAMRPSSLRHSKRERKAEIRNAGTQGNSSVWRYVLVLSALAYLFVIVALVWHHETLLNRLFQNYKPGVYLCVCVCVCVCACVCVCVCAFVRMGGYL
jgi:hypothetical protein